MAYAKIVNASVDADKYTWVEFDIYDQISEGVDGVIASHRQGFPAERETSPVLKTRVVTDYDVNGVPSGSHEEEFEDQVETGRELPVPREKIEEAISNYMRDILPFINASATVNTGDVVHLA